MRFFLFFLLLGSVVGFAFNNCGALAPRHKQYTRDSVNKKQDHYPWPNETTTLKDSNIIASEVLFSDVDGDFVEDAVFFSRSGDSGSQSPFILRLVRSGDFREIKNISGLVNQPDSDTGMLIIDVDLKGKKKELIYLSDSRKKIVILDLVGESTGDEHVLLPVEPLENSSGFSVRDNGANRLVEIGRNIVFISKRTDELKPVPGPVYGSRLVRASSVISLESALVPIDGGWSDFSDWLDWPNGLKCSKICGDGYKIRFRLCNQPVPRNGGAQCFATDINGERVMTFQRLDCRLRDCTGQEDCDEYEIFNEISKNCDPNPNKPRPDPGSQCRDQRNSGGLNSGSSDLQEAAGCPPVGGPDGDFPPGPEGCPDNSVLNRQTGKCQCSNGTIKDPYIDQCFIPHSFNDIYLEHRERVDRGPGGIEFIIHKYRITLSHSRSFSAYAKNEKYIADQFCQYKGYGAALNFDVGTYVSGVGGESQNAYVLCSFGNGMNPGSRSQCPVRRVNANNQEHVFVAFGYRGITHPVGEEVIYLENVRCRERTNREILQ